MSKVFVVVGLTYGDEGKGTSVDYLVRSHKAKLVVRFNGGPQAAHFVVRNKDKAVHCFAQYGSGMLASDDVDTFLSRYMFIEPFRLQCEAEVLEGRGVRDPLRRMFIDREAYVITPLHILLNQMLEISRGIGKHGSTGLGVGIAAMEALLNIHIHLDKNEPILTLKMGDFLDLGQLSDKVSQIIAQKLKQIQHIISECKDETILKNLNKHYNEFLDEFVLELLDQYVEFAQRLNGNQQIVDGAQFLNGYVERGDAIVFEGAQGALLDTDYGFFPHVTATSCTTKNANTLLSEVKHKYERKTVGILRTYFHRHGAGPFVSETLDSNFISLVPELHNSKNLWQDHFRIGYLDIPALKYGLSINEDVDCFSLTHLDYIPNDGNWPIVFDYKYSGSESTEHIDKYLHWNNVDGSIIVTGIKAHKECQETTTLLYQCKPNKVINLRDLTKEGGGEGEGAGYAQVMVDFLERELGRKVYIKSYGETECEKSFV